MLNILNDYRLYIYIYIYTHTHTHIYCLVTCIVFPNSLPLHSISVSSQPLLGSAVLLSPMSVCSPTAQRTACPSKVLCLLSWMASALLSTGLLMMLMSMNTCTGWLGPRPVESCLPLWLPLDCHVWSMAFFWSEMTGVYMERERERECVCVCVCVPEE